MMNISCDWSAVKTELYSLFSTVAVIKMLLIEQQLDNNGPTGINEWEHKKAILAIFCCINGIFLVVKKHQDGAHAQKRAARKRSVPLSTWNKFAFNRFIKRLTLHLCYRLNVCSHWASLHR